MAATTLLTISTLNFMTERYGPDVVAELEELRTSTRKVTDEELRQTLERLRAIR